MRRRLSVLAATMMVVRAPPVFAQYGGREKGQDQAFLNA
jgi:hypothetical protein